MLKLGALKSAVCNPKSAIGMFRNPQSAIRNPQSERGVTMVVAIMFMVTILLLGGGYLLLTISESKRAKVAEQYIEDFSIADGGVAQAHWRLAATDFKTKVSGEGDSYFVITLPDASVCTVIVTTP
ncbi:MAG: hypothetical protein QME81_19210 [bacterium]|nr:hypothetical protein [bacterium]